MLDTSLLFEAITAGTWHTCGLQSEGGVVCTGSGDYEFGQSTPPAGYSWE